MCMYISSFMYRYTNTYKYSTNCIDVLSFFEKKSCFLETCLLNANHLVAKHTTFTINRRREQANGADHVHAPSHAELNKVSDHGLADFFCYNFFVEAAIQGVL